MAAEEDPAGDALVGHGAGAGAGAGALGAPPAPPAVLDPVDLTALDVPDALSFAAVQALGDQCKAMGVIRWSRAIPNLKAKMPDAHDQIAACLVLTEEDLPSADDTSLADLKALLALVAPGGFPPPGTKAACLYHIGERLHHVHEKLQSLADYAALSSRKSSSGGAERRTGTVRVASSSSDRVNRKARILTKLLGTPDTLHPLEAADTLFAALHAAAKTDVMLNGGRHQVSLWTPTVLKSVAELNFAPAVKAAIAAKKHGGVFWAVDTVGRLFVAGLTAVLAKHPATPVVSVKDWTSFWDGARAFVRQLIVADVVGPGQLARLCSFLVADTFQSSVNSGAVASIRSFWSDVWDPALTHSPARAGRGL